MGPDMQHTHDVHQIVDKHGHVASHETTSASLRKEPPLFEWKQVSRVSHTLGQQVKIYVHKVPTCAGEAVIRTWEDLAGSSGIPYYWAIAQAGLHTAAVHKALLSS